MNPDNILILPGWLSSGPDHWQSRWERDHGYTRVEQHDWQRPLRGDWIARLEEMLLGCTEPAVLVAHSLGCLTVAAWAVHSQNTHLVKAALLVAPPDTAREDIAQTLPGWAVDQLPLQKLPFTTVVFASSNDPFCALDRAEQFAQAWGSAFQSVGARGHINADSGLGDWLDAHAQLQQLIATAHAAPDENLLGKSQGYPTGNAITWASNPNRVGSWSALHTVPGIQSRKVARATAVRPLASAVQPAPIAYRYRNTDYTLADYLQRQRATGLLVLKNGEIAAEHYRYGRKDDARFLSFSLSKSITALLVGAALARGSIASLDDTAETYAKTLADSPYGATTLRHLLRMGSGLTFGERYDGSDDIARLSRASAGEPGAGTPAARSPAGIRQRGRSLFTPAQKPTCSAVCWPKPPVKTWPNSPTTGCGNPWGPSTMLIGASAQTGKSRRMALSVPACETGHAWACSSPTMAKWAHNKSWRVSICSTPPTQAASPQRSDLAWQPNTSATATSSGCCR